MHIGLDLDNTLIDYSAAFPAAGMEMGLIGADSGLAGKEAVKAHLLAGPDGEAAWMRLQGQVYGRFLPLAMLAGGAENFLHMIRIRGFRASIVSHKTRYGHFDPDRVHLWEAARAWLRDKGFFTAQGFAMNEADVHFCETRDAKIETIAKIGCDFFVDDLPEVLNHPRFPEHVGKLWFTSGRDVPDSANLDKYRSWDEIAARFFQSGP